MQDQSEVGKSQAGPSGQASREGGDIAEQMPKEVGNLASHGCEEDIGQVEELSAIRIHDQLPPAVVALAISQNGYALSPTSWLRIPEVKAGETGCMEHF